MNGRERFLTVLDNKKPDRLPIQVHNWMPNYLKDVLGGMDAYEAYDYFGMDPVIYIEPEYVFDEKDLANWVIKTIDLGEDQDNNFHWKRIITTPEGSLTDIGAYNKYTGWITEPIIKDEKDFDIWNKYVPLPITIDWSNVVEAKNRIGDRGIVRGGIFDFGQGSPWQSFVNYMYPIEEAIMDTYDKPEWIHYVLDNILKKKLIVIERSGKIELDLVETGGGAGSSTVISPSIHSEFCLPYDRKQHAAIHAGGAKIVYHLCGGIMPLLDIVAGNGADGLETMTPKDMGGDCNLEEAAKRIGSNLFLIGGFDQNAGFEKGSPLIVKDMVYKLFNSCPDGGYICSPSDHFFFGDPSNIRAFVEAAKECIY
ncbi:MAG: uroporphyrinogen decarboxylase family protein [Saccharofermentanales bacterium]